jgi:outer membrane protein assembly factor BamB
MVLEGDTLRATPHPADLAPGAHTIRFELLDTAGHLTSRTVAFWVDGGPFMVAWKQQLEGSCQSTPLVADGRLYVGANDGGMYAFDAATGEPLWRFDTDGEIRSQPVMAEGDETVYFGSADGSLYAVTTDGELGWRFDTGGPIYGSASVDGDTIVCATNSGEVLALDRRTGTPVWRSGFPEYAIETAPCVADATVYVGAWDRFIYSLDIRDGAQLWRAPSKGSDREGAARYYSPADCAPAFLEGRIFAADRAYSLTVLDSRTGERLMDEGKCVAVSRSPDGGFVYVRHTDDRVSKRRPDGSVVWTAEVPTGSIATPPVEAHGYVWMISSLGTLSVLDAETGQLVALQYKAFPDIYAYAAPAFDRERVYLADMAGHLLALTALWPT